jgi:hypothetical protein
VRSERRDRRKANQLIHTGRVHVFPMAAEAGGVFSEVRGFSLRRGDKGEEFAHRPVGESVHPYYIEISTKSC